MDLNTHQQWLVSFYEQRNWYHLSPFIRLNFLAEEVGEVSRAIRAKEIGRDHPGEAELDQAALDANLKEEMADAMDQILILADKYGLSGENLLAQSESKIKKRYRKS